MVKNIYAKRYRYSKYKLIMVKTANKFNDLYKKLSSDWFLKKDGLGGEIPFFISSHKAQDELIVSDSIKSLKKKLDLKGINILEINLYDVVCDLLETQMGIQEFIDIEQDMDKDEFLDAIQSVLEIHEVFMPKIDQMIKQSKADIYFLTGIGMVYPYIRSHNILHNLQNIAKNAPTLMFFPGDYDGHSLNIFGLLKDDNYYRAFNIDKMESK